MIRFEDLKWDTSNFHLPPTGLDDKINFELRTKYNILTLTFLESFPPLNALQTITLQVEESVKQFFVNTFVMYDTSVMTNSLVLAKYWEIYIEYLANRERIYLAFKNGNLSSVERTLKNSSNSLNAQIFPFDSSFETGQNKNLILSENLELARIYQELWKNLIRSFQQYIMPVYDINSL